MPAHSLLSTLRWQRAAESWIVGYAEVRLPTGLYTITTYDRYRSSRDNPDGQEADARHPSAWDGEGEPTAWEGAFEIDPDCPNSWMVGGPDEYGYSSGNAMSVTEARLAAAEEIIARDRKWTTEGKV